MNLPARSFGDRKAGSWTGNGAQLRNSSSNDVIVTSVPISKRNPPELVSNVGPNHNCGCEVRFFLSTTKQSKEAMICVKKIEAAFIRKGVFPRNCYPDKAIAQFLRRADTSARAVINLTASGFGADALGLCRSLIEDWFALRWITNQETEVRCRRFLLFLAKQLERMKELSETYGPNNQPTVELTARVQKSASEFEKWQSLGPTVKAMAEEVEVLDPDSPLKFDKLSWSYDVTYFLSCCYLHPTAIGMRHRNLRLRTAFSFDRAHEDSEAEQALVAAVAFLALVANRASVYWGLNLTRDIEQCWLEFAKCLNATKAAT
jgi:hypothetical protein